MTHTRTQPMGRPIYYLGRPAAFWLTALAPRSTARNRADKARYPHGFQMAGED